MASKANKANNNIESILLEQRSFSPPAEFTARARVKPADLEALLRRAREDNGGFWKELAASELSWHRPFTVGLDETDAPNYRWFTDGQLNASYNCLDVHLGERGHKTAVIFEGEPGDVRRLSYRELHAEVCRFANALKAQGIAKGDRVIIYMPLVPELLIAMHACNRIGAARSHRGHAGTARDHRRRRLARWSGGGSQERHRPGAERRGAERAARHRPAPH